MTLRRIATLSAIFAISGINSPNWTPGGWWDGRRSAKLGHGVGLGVPVSMCPGPPLSQNRMTLVSAVRPGAAFAGWLRIATITQSQQTGLQKIAA